MINGTIWVKPIDYFKKIDPNVIEDPINDWQEEIGKIFLIAVDEKGIVVGLRLKSFKINI